MSTSQQLLTKIKQPPFSFIAGSLHNQSNSSYYYGSSCHEQHSNSEQFKFRSLSNTTGGISLSQNSTTSEEEAGNEVLLKEKNLVSKEERYVIQEEEQYSEGKQQQKLFEKNKIENGNESKESGIIMKQSISSTNTLSATAAEKSKIQDQMSNESGRYWNSQFRDQVKLFHESQYFRIKSSSNFLEQNKAQCKKRRIGVLSDRFQQGISQSNVKIPEIQEWFSTLSVDQRVLALSSIDKHATDSIIRMKKKLIKHGPGLFILKTRIISQRQLPTQQISTKKRNSFNNEDFVQVMKQDFCLTSIKELINKGKKDRHDETLLAEKEFLANIRITETAEQNDTLTITSHLVQDVEKFFTLMRSIVGQTFLKIPYDNLWDEQKNCFLTISPPWFQPENYNSLAAWIIYYLERALWMHFNINVKGIINNIQHNFNKDKVFVDPQGSLINAKVELLDFWKELYEKAMKDKKVFNQLEEELIHRTYEQFKQEALIGFGTINNLNGGIHADEQDQEEDNFYNGNAALDHLTILFNKQEPEKFIQNLCMISLDRLNNLDHYQMEKNFLSILKEKQALGINKCLSNQNKKNQKKKLKKKQKLQMKLQQQQQSEVFSQKTSQEEQNQNEEENCNSKMMNGSVVNSKTNISQSEEKEEIQKDSLKQYPYNNDESRKKSDQAMEESQEEEEEEDELEQLQQLDEEEEEIEEVDEDEEEKFEEEEEENYEFISNQQILGSHQSTTNARRDDKKIKNLLQELLDEEPIEKVLTQQKEEKEVIVREVPLETPLYEEIIYEINNIEEHHYEVMQVIMQQQPSEEKYESQSRKEDGSAFSESTDDMQEANHQNDTTTIVEQQIQNQSSTPQASIKPKIVQDLLNLIESEQIVKSEENADPNIEKEEELPSQSEKDSNAQKLSNNTPLKKTQIKGKSMNESGGNKKGKASYQSNNEEEAINNFIIIRSSNGFQTQNESNNSSSQFQINKKKKKKRSKPVLFAQQQNQVFKEQSFKLNSFMRSMISSTDENQQEDSDEHQKKKLNLKEKESKTPAVSNKTEQQKSTNKAQLTTASGGVQEVQQVYIKKKSLVEESKTVVSSKKSPGDSLQINQEEQQSYEMLKKDSLDEDDIQSQKKMQRQFSYAKEKYGAVELKQKVANNNNSNSNQTRRFDTFLNQKEISAQSVRSNDDMKFTAKNIGNEVKKPKKQSQKNKKPKKKSVKSPNLDFQPTSNFVKSHSLGQATVMTPQELFCNQMNSEYPPRPELNFQMYPQISSPVLDFNHLQQILTDVLQQQQYYQMGYNQQPFGQECIGMQQQWMNQNNLQGSQGGMEEMMNDVAELELQQNLSFELTETFFEQMEKQMKQFVKGIEQKLTSVRKERAQVITVIQENIQKSYNNHSVKPKNGYMNKNFIGIKMYGSMASGLAIDSSDVDLAVTGLNFNGNRDLHLKEMRQLQEQLAFLPWVQSIKFIESATIPVIKLQIDLAKVRQKLLNKERQTLGSSCMTQPLPPMEESMRILGMDITFEDSSPSQMYDNYSLMGVSRVNLGIECINYIQTLCMQLTDLKPIVMILKKLLQNHNLNQPYLGGLCSYSLVIMTSTFLKQQNANSMAKNLTEFLNYYGNFFNPSMTQLNGEAFYPIYEIRQDPMVVNDPLNTKNNTTRNTFRIKDIQEVFSKAHAFIVSKLNLYKEQQLMASCNANPHDPQLEIIQNLIDLKW